MRPVFILLLGLTAFQISTRLPITIEVERDVQVSRSVDRGERRGTLYLDDVKSRPFRLTKGQRFHMVAVGQEGGCRIKFDGREYGLISCPWLQGFRDHQTDLFRVVAK